MPRPRELEQPLYIAHPMCTTGHPNVQVSQPLLVPPNISQNLQTSPKTTTSLGSPHTSPAPNTSVPKYLTVHFVPQPVPEGPVRCGAQTRWANASRVTVRFRSQMESTSQPWRHQTHAVLVLFVHKPAEHAKSPQDARTLCTPSFQNMLCS